MPRLVIKPRPSSYFILLQLLMLFGSLMIIGYLPLPAMGSLVLLSIVLIYSAVIFISGRTQPTISHDEAGWSLDFNENTVSAELCGDSTVTGFVAILRFILPNRRRKYTCILFRDALSADDFRRLVVTVRNMRQ